MATNDERGLWARILGITASTLAAFAAGAGALVIGPALDRIESNTGILGGMAVSMAQYSSGLHDHVERDRYWWAKVEKNSESLTDLATDSRSRPDPFTGADGKELRSLIDANERRLDLAERGAATMDELAKRVDSLSKAADEERIYYRRSVIPLVESIHRQLKEK